MKIHSVVIGCGLMAMAIVGTEYLERVLGSDLWSIPALTAGCIIGVIGVWFVTKDSSDGGFK
jgi:hypothetical protein